MGNQRILLTGGSLISTGDPSNSCYEVNATNPSKSARKKNLNFRRYAHQSVSLNGYAFVMGGFDNKDSEG
jgi:hypothetical protein